jgi:5'-3' exoribonuclease 2
MEGVELQNKKFDLLTEFKKKNIDVQDIEEYVNKKSFDSNLITPGTTFLSSVGEAIREYVRKRIQSHRLWKNLTVVYSDASCPGEGEHKIMEFIRQERASPGYDPNQSHCIYGADADLIMLGLATHEPRFFIIREIVITANDKFCTSCGKKGHYFIDCRPADSIEQEQAVQDVQNAEAIGVQFQFLNLKLVREFLHLTFMRANVPFGYNIERVIDDFVFLCFFVGNDFLPHVPCLTIREGGIDILMRVYDYCLSIMPDYLTFEGAVNFTSLKLFIN